MFALIFFFVLWCYIEQLQSGSVHAGYKIISKNDHRIFIIHRFYVAFVSDVGAYWPIYTNIFVMFILANVQSYLKRLCMLYLR